jgi:hypothetical protein
MVFAAATNKFGKQPQYDLFRCLVCKFYEVVKA